MPRLYVDFVDGTSSADITASETTLSSAGLSRLPSISGSDYVLLSLDADGSAGSPEVVQVVSHSSGATTATIVRAQLGTTARAHTAGTDWACSSHAVDFQRLDTHDSQIAALQTADTAAIGRLNAIEADNWVTAARIASGAVGADEIAAGAVTLAKLAADSVDASKIVDGSVGTSELAANAVTTVKITDASVTRAKLASDISTIPTGAIQLWPVSTPPSGWLICDGAAISRTTYSALFAVIGTVYGGGDGTTTFNLPNFKGRVPVGLDAGQTEFDTIGETGGAKTHTLASGEMPSHAHGVNDPTHAHGPSGGATEFTGQKAYDGVNLAVAVSGTAKTALNFSTTAAAATGISIQNAGGGGAHNNLQPYMVLHYVIRT